MVCDCCGRKRKMLESFAAVQYKQTQMNFCVGCNDLAYKVRDDANEQNEDEYNKHIEEWNKRAHKPSEVFIAWQKEFVAPFEDMFKKEEA